MGVFYWLEGISGTEIPTPLKRSNATFTYNEVIYLRSNKTSSNMSNTTNRTMSLIAKETYAEKKARVHQELEAKLRDYEVRKVKEAKLKKEQSLVKTTAFKISAQDHTRLKEVAATLGITPSEFVRDATTEAINVLHLSKQ